MPTLQIMLDPAQGGGHLASIEVADDFNPAHHIAENGWFTVAGTDGTHLAVHSKRIVAITVSP